MFRSVIVCEDSDQLIKLVASQEGVDVTEEAEEGTNAIDVDSLPALPLSAPPPPTRPQFVQPPPQSAPQAQFQNGGQFAGQAPPRAARPRPPQPRPSNPLANLFGNFRLPFF